MVRLEVAPKGTRWCMSPRYLGSVDLTWGGSYNPKNYYHISFERSHRGTDLSVESITLPPDGRPLSPFTLPRRLSSLGHDLVRVL